MSAADDHKTSNKGNGNYPLKKLVRKCHGVGGGGGVYG